MVLGLNVVYLFSFTQVFKVNVQTEYYFKQSSGFLYSDADEHFLHKKGISTL